MLLRFINEILLQKKNRMKKSVVIIGGGFAGVEAAIQLVKSKLFDVTLISERDYLFLYPVSIWIPVRKINEKNVRLPLSEIQAKYPFRLIIDRVERINAQYNNVICSKNEYKYDELIIALGASKMKLKGIENSYSICGSPGVHQVIAGKLDELINRGFGNIAVGFSGNPKDQSAVRGGPAFEMIFNIHQKLKSKGLRNKFTLTVYAPMAEPGAKMGKPALKMMDKMFLSNGFEKRFGKKIKEFNQTEVVFEDDSTLPFDLNIFIPASDGNEVLSNSMLPLNDAGFVKIDSFLQVPGFENIYATGDSAALEGEWWVAKQGHIAEAMGRAAAYNLIQKSRGLKNFKSYKEHLGIICLMDTGNGAALVMRNDKHERIFPLPVIGHWMKIMWGKYARWSKTGKFPRIPGM